MTQIKSVDAPCSFASAVEFGGQGIASSHGLQSAAQMINIDAQSSFGVALKFLDSGVEGPGETAECAWVLVYINPGARIFPVE
jgi:hypothetical protein